MTRDIRFLRVSYLHGPNMWTYRPCLEAWVDIGDLEDSPSNTIPGLYERLTSWLPGLVEHRCGVGERGGFLERLREGTWAAHILEHVAIELQNLAGMQTGFGKARQTSVRGVYKVAVRSREETVGRACLEAGRALLLAAIDDLPFDMPATVKRLRDMADRLCLGPSTTCIIDAARERGIPALRLAEGSNLVQLGHGARQRRIWTAETDRTSAIAETISRDKDLTKSLLQSCGVPVPEGRIVDSAGDAWDAAQSIGLPVAVKPTDANHGRGVSLDLNTREDVEAAYLLAEAEGSEVIVERFVPGNEHRLLVVGGRVVAAARGETAAVTGDGHSTVVQLVESQLNTDPRRGTSEDYPLNHVDVEGDPAIQLDLQRQGLAPDSVVAAGRVVLIQRNGNVAFDVSDLVHPEVAAVAGLAARVVGLDIAGIDLVAEDISRPLEAQRGAIVEVNAGPGLLMHLKPANGAPRPVGRPIVDHLFPAEDNGRIPIVGIAGGPGTTPVARLIAWLLHLAGRRVGLACADGLYLGLRRTEPGEAVNWQSVERVLMNRSVDACVFEHDCEAILAEGLAYDRCQVGVVTGMVDPAALSGYYIGEPEQVYNILRTQVDVVLPGGYAVLNAGEPLVAQMASLCDGGTILYGRDPGLPVIAVHCAQGGRAVYLRDEELVLASGREERVIAPLAALRLAQPGQPGLDLDQVLAAAGAAWALEVPPELICTGIETFDHARSAAAGGTPHMDPAPY